MDHSPDFERILRDYQITLAGLQPEPGDETVPINVPIREGDEPYPDEIESAHRTLFRVDDDQGNTHWYWRMGGTEGWEDAVNYIVDLALSGDYKELSE